MIIKPGKININLSMQNYKSEGNTRKDKKIEKANVQKVQLELMKDTTTRHRVYKV